MNHRSLVRMLLQPMAIALALGLLVRAAVNIYSIPSESMAPTLAVGDKIVVTRYLAGGPQRGDIVVFRSPAAPDELLVKRVIAVPGDLIDSRLGRVRVGGYTLAEPYLLRQAASGAVPSQLIPLDSYFVLGDNRDQSLDSRNWGAVPRSMIVGRARMILWSSPVDGDDAAHASTSSKNAPAWRASPPSRLFKWLS